MYFKHHKNGSVTLFREAEDDRSMTLDDIVVAMADSIDLTVYEVSDIQSLGNFEVYYTLAVFAKNGRLYDYDVSSFDARDFNRRGQLTLQPGWLHPMFTMPPFYRVVDHFSPYAKPGAISDGRLFYLCDEPDDDTRWQMEAAGCKFMWSTPEYAPEIKRRVVWVPFGVGFDY